MSRDKGCLQAIEVYPNDTRPGRPNDFLQEAKDRAKAWRTMGYLARTHVRQISADGVTLRCAVVIVRDQTKGDP